MDQQTFSTGEAQTEAVGATFDVPPQGVPKKVQTMKSRRQQQIVFIVKLLAVPVAYWLFHWIYINGSAILMAFQDKQGAWSLSNFPVVFEALFYPDQSTSTLGISVLNSVVTWCASEFIGVPISLMVSYFLYKQIAGYKFFRVVFYFPHIISGVVLITVYRQLLAPNGVFEKLIEGMGGSLPGQGVLFTPGYATPAIIVYVLWTNACGNMLFYSAMSRVPPELIEVGKIEGLGWFKELILVILPLIWPTFSTTLVLDLCNILQSGGPVLLFGTDVISQGQTHTLSYWFFSKVYGSSVFRGSYGVMSCAGLVFTSVSVPFTLIIRRLLDKVSTAEY